MKVKLSILDLLLIIATIPLAILAWQIYVDSWEIVRYRSAAEAMTESRQHFREQAFLKRTELCNEIFAHDEYPGDLSLVEQARAAGGGKLP